MDGKNQGCNENLPAVNKSNMECMFDIPPLNILKTEL